MNEHIATTFADILNRFAAIPQQAAAIHERSVGHLEEPLTLDEARAKVKSANSDSFLRRYVVYAGPKGARTSREVIEAMSHWEAMLQIAELLDGKEGGYRAIRCSDPEGEDEHSFTLTDSDDTGARWRVCRWCGAEMEESHE